MSNLNKSETTKQRTLLDVLRQPLTDEEYEKVTAFGRNSDDDIARAAGIAVAEAIAEWLSRQYGEDVSDWINFEIQATIRKAIAEAKEDVE